MNSFVLCMFLTDNFVPAAKYIDRMNAILWRVNHFIIFLYSVVLTQTFFQCLNVSCEPKMFSLCSANEITFSNYSAHIYVLSRHEHWPIVPF